MSDYELQRLDKQRDEILQLLSLFNRAAFRPFDKNNSGDPTAVLNAIWDTRIALSTRGASLLQYGQAAVFFRQLSEGLWELEKKIQDKYPKVVALAYDWREKPLNTGGRIESIKKALGDEYTKAACFIRNEALSVYDSPDKALEILTQLDLEIKQLIDSKYTMAQRIGILFLAAEPKDAPPLRLGEECREIRETLRGANLRDRFRFEQRMSVRVKDITQALLDEQPSIVHFSGHGTDTSDLCFENELGETLPVPAPVLSALFEQFADQVNCVVLNACFTEIQAKAIAKHIKYVIGMSNEIGDQAAIAFSTGFYQAIGVGRNEKDAYKLGCLQIELQKIPESLVPVLIEKTTHQM